MTFNGILSFNTLFLYIVVLYIINMIMCMNVPYTANIDFFTCICITYTHLQVKTINIFARTYINPN